MTDISHNLCKVRFEPAGLKAEVPCGSTILDAARLAGVYLTNVCGGDGTCGKCKVLVDGQTVLACQTPLLSDTTVTVPEGHGLDAGRILVGVDAHEGPHAAPAGTFPYEPVLPPATAGARCGLAIDIGTTTVVVHLLDFEARETFGAEACYNSQMHYGDDYIRRIMYAEEHRGWREMQRRITGDIDSLAAALVSRHSVRLADIGAIVCSGNTAMIHFLLGQEAGWIRRGHERPDALAPAPCLATDLGLAAAPGAEVYCLPAVGAYVGADIVAGVLATRLYDADRPSLLIDIGTNGEVVLGSKEWMVSASSSAGPAFEGSGIRHGMRAAPGAIERMTLAADGSLRYQTVGGEPPRGLCGTGLLDTLAALFDAGLIDRGGRLLAEGDARLSDGADGPEFTLVPAADGRLPIVITQADIQNLIRSKAGVYAAIQVLMESTGVAAADLEAIYLAGGFGNYLDVRKTIAIGMLPDIQVERVRFVGNTSIAGAKMAAMSRSAMNKAREVAGRMTYFDLMNHPHYMDAFIQANFLPHTDLDLFPSAARRRTQGKK
jgi:uncharacterized 2Fe-2S/4Fe-4S cluster protein (DUF4445 family)